LVNGLKKKSPGGKNDAKGIRPHHSKGTRVCRDRKKKKDTGKKRRGKKYGKAAFAQKNRRNESVQ